MEALSAKADGEDPGVDPHLLDAHLRTCASCRSFAGDIGRLRRHSAVREAETMPDLAPRVSKMNAVADRASHWTLIRALLAVVALFILANSIPALVFGHEESTSEHAARHLGAFTAAYAMALLVVVVRPARARSILPVTIVLAGALLITAGIDVLDGQIPMIEETAHLPELLSVGLVWLIARPLDPPTQTRRNTEETGTLRLLGTEPEDPEDLGQRESG
jgi:predicted anti-sigma-YlaC factor YlaD